MRYQIEHESIKDYQPDIPKIALSNIPDIQDHSIEYINIYNVLEIADNIDYLLSLIQSKLRLKGVLSLIGLDLNRLCELYLDRVIDSKEFNNLINHKTIYPLSDIVKILTDNKYKITVIKTDRLLYYIECGRPLDE